jgi:hypothetical protein
LAAQIAWHFIDGFNVRYAYKEPSEQNENLKRYFVKSPIPNIELIFIQNTTNDNWWMVLPPTSKSAGESKTISCSYNDYLRASNGDVPERWLRAWKRIT